MPPFDTTLLIIMNPREIPDCMRALERLNIDKAWASYYTETELEHVVAEIINTTRYNRYTIISDDTIPSQAALDEVLRIHDTYPDAVACGWVNIDAVSKMSTYHPRPLRGTGPNADTYRFTPLAEAHTMRGIQRTYFHAQTFATMTRDMWLKYPFGSYNGCASDLHQCVRLQDDGIPIYTSANAYVYHVKEVQNRLDQAPEKRLYVGERIPHTRIDRRPLV